jgi:hypothetical protein
MATIKMSKIKESVKEEKKVYKKENIDMKKELMKLKKVELVRRYLEVRKENDRVSKDVGIMVGKLQDENIELYKQNEELKKMCDKLRLQNFNVDNKKLNYIKGKIKESIKNGNKKMEKLYTEKYNSLLV